MWNRIMELQPVIHRCARYLSRVYDEDVDELESRMTAALAEKALQNPDILNPGIYCNTGIAIIIKNEIHNYYRHLFGWKLQRSIVSLDTLELVDDNADVDLERQERIEAVRFVLDNMDHECRELIKAILDNDDLIRDSRRKRDDRPCRNMINVSALAERMGKPKRSVARKVSELRSELVESLAFA
jgi:hypothetical protein